MSYENYLKEIKVKIKCFFFTCLSPNFNYPFFNWTLFILDKAVLFEGSCSDEYKRSALQDIFYLKRSPVNEAGKMMKSFN